MVARTTRSILSIFHGPFQMACFGFLWFACGYFILNLLSRMLGDGIFENFVSFLGF